MSSNERDNSEGGNAASETLQAIKRIMGQIHFFTTREIECWINFGTEAFMVTYQHTDDFIHAFLSSRSADELMRANVISKAPNNITLSNMKDVRVSEAEDDEAIATNRLIDTLLEQIEDLHERGISCLLDYETGSREIPVGTRKTKIEYILRGFTSKILLQISVTPDIATTNSSFDEAAEGTNDPLDQFFEKEPPEKWRSFRALLHSLLVFKDELENKGAPSFTMESALLHYLTELPNDLDDSIVIEMVAPLLNAGDLGNVPKEAAYYFQKLGRAELGKRYFNPHELERRRNYGEFTKKTGGTPPNPKFITSYVVLMEAVGDWGVDGFRTYIAALPQSLDEDDISYNVLTEMNRYGNTNEIKAMAWNALVSRTREKPASK